jgi:hypothetical protein
VPPPQVQHHHDDTGHTTQQTMTDAWWHSNLRARAFAMRMRGTVFCNDFVYL